MWLSIWAIRSTLPGDLFGNQIGDMFGDLVGYSLGYNAGYICTWTDLLGYQYGYICGHGFRMDVAIALANKLAIYLAIRLA